MRHWSAESALGLSPKLLAVCPNQLLVTFIISCPFLVPHAGVLSNQAAAWEEAIPLGTPSMVTCCGWLITAGEWQKA